MSQYAKRMAHLSARIFGEMARPTHAGSQRKVIQLMSEEPLHKQKDLINYYPDIENLEMLMRNLRSYGLYRDEHEDFKEEMERLRKLRGKGKVKKGEGKRAMKRKGV